MNERTRRLARRNFLVTLGAGGAATVATVVARRPDSAAPSAGEGSKRATRGYAESSHVRNYYRTTKI